MACEHRFQMEVANAEVEEAEQALIAALDTSWEDDGATDRIVAAMNRLRVAQARQTAARTGAHNLPDLVGRL
jgi:hypothetical protein